MTIPTEITRLTRNFFFIGTPTEKLTAIRGSFRWKHAALQVVAGQTFVSKAMRHEALGNPTVLPNGATALVNKVRSTDQSFATRNRSPVATSSMLPSRSVRQIGAACSDCS